MVIWMLQHRLLVQLHTYVCLMASPSEDEPRQREDEVPFTTRVGGRSLSTPNALSFGSPSRSPLPRASICGGVGEGEHLGVHLGAVARKSDKGSAGNDQGTFIRPHMHTHLPFMWAARSSCRQPPLKEYRKPHSPTSLYFCTFSLLSRGLLKSRAACPSPSCYSQPGIKLDFKPSQRTVEAFVPQGL